jgi:exodeoxyribonuclease V alpha subunit
VGKVFARDRADLGPAHAADQAAREAANYTTPRPLDQVLTELHHVWEREARCRDNIIARIAAAETHCWLVKRKD